MWRKYVASKPATRMANGKTEAMGMGGVSIKAALVAAQATTTAGARMSLAVPRAAMVDLRDASRPVLAHAGVTGFGASLIVTVSSVLTLTLT